MKFFKTISLALLPLLVRGQNDIAFLQPEDSRDIPSPQRFANNPVFQLGDRRTLRWTPNNKSISIVMYQERPKDEFEYVFQNSRGIDRYTWNVGTGKNLTNGHVFFFQIFIEGATSPTASSRYFNLTDPKEVTTTTTSSSSPSTVSLTSSTSSSATRTGVLASATGSGSPTPSSSGVPIVDTGLSTGAKVGLGVAIPLAVIALAGLAFFLIRRRRKSSEPAELGGAGAGAGADYTNNVPPQTQVVSHEKYSEPAAGEYVPNATQEQAGGYYKPQGSPNAAASEIYTPPTQPQEMPSQRYM